MARATWPSIPKAGFGETAGDGACHRLFVSRFSGQPLTGKPSKRIKQEERSRLPGGAVHLTLTGEPGRTNTIEVSTDLANWGPLTNLVNPTATVQWTDTLPAGSNRWFYRAIGL